MKLEKSRIKKKLKNKMGNKSGKLADCQQNLKTTIEDKNNQIALLQGNLNASEQRNRIQGQCNLNLYPCTSADVPFLYIRPDEVAQILDITQIQQAFLQFSTLTFCDSVQVGPGTQTPFALRTVNNQNVYALTLPVEVNPFLDSDVWVRLVITTDTNAFVTNSVNVGFVTTTGVFGACGFTT